MLFSCRELIRGYNEFLFVLFLLSACHVELNFLQKFNFENRNFCVLQKLILRLCKNVFSLWGFTFCKCHHHYHHPLATGVESGHT